MILIYSKPIVKNAHIKKKKKKKKKRSTSAYAEYELRIEEYDLRMLTYVRRTRGVPFVSRYAVDTRSRYAIV